MNLDRVKYKEGRPYMEHFFRTGKRKGDIHRTFGQIIICQNCGKKCFAQNSNLKIGYGKFCTSKCQMQGQYNPDWKGGKCKHGDGYILTYNPKHPFCTKDGYVMEHRLIIEKQIGRYLHRWEVVHHINKTRDDNRPENLMAFNNSANHHRFERKCPIKSSDIIFDGRKVKI